jgi:hypothetical protein
MPFFRRGHEPAAPYPSVPADTPAEDTPGALREAQWTLSQFVNAHAGRLPVESVVAALRVTDTLGEVIDTSAARPLDINAVVAVKAILTDYLPTTLRSYLSLDPAMADTPRPSGSTPRTSLEEQVDALWSAAADVLTACRAQDVDALLTQGSFLRTKYAGSDLDL